MGLEKWPELKTPSDMHLEPDIRLVEYLHVSANGNRVEDSHHLPRGTMEGRFSTMVRPSLVHDRYGVTPTAALYADHRPTTAPYHDLSRI